MIFGLDLDLLFEEIIIIIIIIRHFTITLNSIIKINLLIYLMIQPFHLTSLHFIYLYSFYFLVPPPSLNFFPSLSQIKPYYNHLLAILIH